MATVVKTRKIRILFSDYFRLEKEVMSKEDILDVSLLSDLPLFIDPFLLFNSEKPEYQDLHKKIIGYITYLKLKSQKAEGHIPKGLLDHLYRFPEIKQNWLGYSFIGNDGHGLGPKFARTLNSNFITSLSDFGEEKITSSSHLEKLSLVSKGVGKDNVSDFATNLLKEYLLELTQTFSKRYIDKKLLKVITVPRVHFNYETETWVDKDYELPWYKDDYILLTPRDLLTKDNTWVNKEEFYKDFESIPFAIGNEELRAKINNYLVKKLHENTKEKKIDDDGTLVYKTTPQERLVSLHEVFDMFPVLADYFLKLKEAEKEKATPVSIKNVEFIEKVLVENFSNLVTKFIGADFYSKPATSYKESLERAKYFKKCIEEHDIWQNLYHEGKPVGEEYVQKLFRLVWYGTLKDVNREVENGLGIVDYTISEGALDKTVLEFKLAKSTSLEKNLKSQLETYKQVNSTDFGIWVIVYFSNEEKKKVEDILKRLEIINAENIILIDAREKVSASKK